MTTGQAGILGFPEGPRAAHRLAAIPLPEVSIVQATALTASAFGQIHHCTGGSAYTITLPKPLGHAGKWISFRINTTSYKIVTISRNGTETISGETSLKYVTGEWCTLYCDGVNWSIVEEHLLPVFCYAYRSTNQTINPGWQIVALDTVVVDNFSWFTTGSSAKFTPLAPGKYVANGVANLQGVAAGLSVYLAVFKNGVGGQGGLTRLDNTGSSSSSSYLPTTKTFDLNGTTDYIDLEVYNAEASASRTLGSGENAAFLSVVRVGR